jgi:hypothetical protein
MPILPKFEALLRMGKKASFLIKFRSFGSSLNVSLSGLKIFLLYIRVNLRGGSIKLLFIGYLITFLFVLSRSFKIV